MAASVAGGGLAAFGAGGGLAAFGAGRVVRWGCGRVWSYRGHALQASADTLAHPSLPRGGWCWLPLAPVVVWLPLAPVAAFGAGGGCVVGNLRWRRLVFLVLCDFSVYHFFGA